MTRKTTRFFVSINAQGEPVNQRSSLRDVTYRSANTSSSFSKNPPNASRPLRVVEVARPIEWTGACQFADGSTLHYWSKVAACGGLFASYEYNSAHMSKPETYETWHLRDQADLDAHLAGMTRRGYDVRVIVSALVTKSLLNWPQPAIEQQRGAA